MNAIAKLKLNHLTPHATTVLVLGGYGFIGRHIVSELKALNTSVLIGTRRKANALSPTSERCIELHKLIHNPTWRQQLDEVDVIVNTVGILRQRWGETYNQVHHQAVIELANVCAERGIRFIHISALGLNNQHKSRFLSHKLLGEQALVKSRADWHLVRPSLVDGEGGYGAKWFRRVANWPVHLIPNNARGGITPIKAQDLGKAVAAIALSKNELGLARSADRIYELGGQVTMSLRQYLGVLRLPEKPYKALCIRIPAIVSRALSHLCDLFHLTPFSFGHYELLKYDNLPRHNRLAELLADWASLNRPQSLAPVTDLTADTMSLAI